MKIFVKVIVAIKGIVLYNSLVWSIKTHDMLGNYTWLFR